MNFIQHKYYQMIMALPKVTLEDITPHIAEMLAYFGIEEDKWLAYTDAIINMKITDRGDNMDIFKVNDLSGVAIHLAIDKYGLVVKKYYEQEGYKPEEEQGGEIED